MYSFTTHSAITEIPAADWNALCDPDAPFLRHELLAAMERHGCVGEALGWIPIHLALRDPSGKLVAAAPCYIKHNSYGELVFDWSWADAYHRNGLEYYPKLVVASPYTPVTAPRILTPPGTGYTERAAALVRGSVELAEQLGVSSLHWLFTTDSETRLLEDQGLMRRIGCQFHWHNDGYRSFDELLGRFTAEKRKKVRRERRRVAEAGIEMERIPGHEVGEAQWETFHRLYCDTFDKRGGIPTLTLPFFREIAETMGDRLLLILARHRGKIVAGAFSLVGERSLFGRHWGCFEEFHSLHFEACYYQGLDHCIETGLARFEPGAQGEHKVSRGFLPAATWSAHWIAHPGFQAAISRFLDQESEYMADYLAEMQEHSPYRKSP